ncbi:MAG: hypothetical protein KC468_07355 [Myxococcales bacterium]|nr:hypothetical protein [Myxococcales bacterium]
MTRHPHALLATTIASAMVLSTACSITDNGSDGTDSNTSSNATDSTDSAGTSAGPTSDTSVTMGDEVTIPMIRQGMVPVDTIVTVKDVIVTAPPRIYGAEDQYVQYYLADPAGGEWSGIYLFSFSDIGLDLKVGDQVTVTGAYTEYNFVSQIQLNDLAAIQVTGTATPPAPVVVSPGTLASDASGEPYESVLVRVENVDVTDDTPGFGNYILTDGLTLNNQYLYAAGESFNPVNGDSFGAITGPLARNTFGDGYFYIAPRDWNDIENWDMGGNTTDPTTGTGEDVSVYDIQMGNVTPGATVTVVDVLVSSPTTFSGNNMYVQEQAGGAFSGINVFLPNGAPALSVGDIVDVTGTYEEYFDNSQIVVQDMADIVSKGGNMPVTPEVLTPADCMLEDWEGVLATIENATVTVEGVDPYWEWEIDGIKMDKQFFADADWPHPAVDTSYSSLTGPLRFAFDARRMAPRDASDIVQ